MNEIPIDLYYSESHEWARVESGDTVLIGITDYAQRMLGEMVFVELPEVGSEVQSGDELGVVESVKAASDLYSPIAGEVIEVNEVLRETPDLVNEDPYGNGWICRMHIQNTEEVSNLLDSENYGELIAEEE